MNGRTDHVLKYFEKKKKKTYLIWRVWKRRKWNFNLLIRRSCTDRRVRQVILRGGKLNKGKKWDEIWGVFRQREKGGIDGRSISMTCHVWTNINRKHPCNSTSAIINFASPSVSVFVSHIGGDVCLACLPGFCIGGEEVLSVWWHLTLFSLLLTLSALPMFDK